MKEIKINNDQFSDFVPESIKEKRVNLSQEDEEFLESLSRTDLASAILHVLYVLGKIPGYDLSFLNKCLTELEKDIDLSEEDYKRVHKIFDIIEYAMGAHDDSKKIYTWSFAFKDAQEPTQKFEGKIFL